MSPFDLILDARKAATIGNWDESDQLYLMAISILEERKDLSADSKENFLSVQAEYFSNRPYLPDIETFDEFRCRVLLTIRYINECYKLNGKNSDLYFTKMYEIMRNFIKSYGCHIPESEHHIIMSCPIQLDSDKFGSLGVNAGAYYDKAICSICKLDLLDKNCSHVINRVYDDKQCVPIFENDRIAHFALDRPKDPKSRITDIFYPKDMIIEKAQMDKSKVNLEKLNVNCTRCRQERIDPVSITPELFFEMQGLNISFDKEQKTETKELKKGVVYFKSLFSSNYKQM
ncbi:MAG: hypothetical protein OXC46_01060 [Thaumarchaeota archaeon]|nr:hypothetical protein [Nitrososphaerota archaeon]